MSSCPVCDKEIEQDAFDEFPYSGGVICPHCFSPLSTDWDEDEDNMYWWIDGVAEVPIAKV